MYPSDMCSRWAREYGCRWYAVTTFYYAARTGQPELLHWVRENNADSKVWS
jgi:hypothetical protein